MGKENASRRQHVKVLGALSWLGSSRTVCSNPNRNCRASEAVRAAQIRKPRYEVGNTFDKVTQQAKYHS